MSNKTIKSKNKMPLQVWILTLSAFAIGTAEFVIAGILTQVAESLNISNGMAGHLITAYALAIVIGGPLLTLWLVRYDKKKVLIALMFLFITGNFIASFSTDYYVLLFSRVLAGLTQGPFYGIGAVVASKLVSDNMKGQAVGQMFAGLTLANVLGVPAGAWIGTMYGWNITFLLVAILGVIATFFIITIIPKQGKDKGTTTNLMEQIKALKNKDLLASFAFTILAWIGFMTFYGYISPISENISNFHRENVTWVLVIIGVGLVIGNLLGGKTADKSLKASLLFWPITMIISLVIAGLLAPYKWPFLIAAFVFGITSFANVPAMQMRVMKYAGKIEELASTINISAFNVANALGGIIGAIVVDSHFGAGYIPYAAATASLIGVFFILTQEKK